MSKNEKNALDANELESVAGGANEANAYYHDLHETAGFKEGWTESNAWDYDLVQMMIDKYGEDYTSQAISTYGTPKEFFK